MAVRTAIKDVTPEVAQRLLGRNSRNRPVRASHVRQLAEAMSSGRWDFNGESIKISQDGSLLDGQHRLMAIREAQVTVRMVVVEGLPTPAQDTVDTGRRRKLSDVLFIAGHPDANALATALNALHRYRTTGGFAPGASPTVREALELLEREPTLIESVRVARRVTKEIRGPIGVFAACHHIFSMVDQDAADEFFQKLQVGDELKRGDPIYHLRRHVLRTRQDRAYAKRPQHMGALTFKAFNLWRSGERVELLTYKSGGTAPERFPALDVAMQRQSSSPLPGRASRKR
jgi:hypothetical protein